VSNALKFTERGSVNVAVKVARGDVVFTVSDTGIGIPKDSFDRIFEEFGQIENPLQTKVKGTGLGLALSRRLAEGLGGTLTVNSRVGKGSTFTLRVPRKHAEVTEFQALETRVDPARARGADEYWLEPVDQEHTLRKLAPAAAQNGER
jgi:signal transduction histidine kinase